MSTGQLHKGSWQASHVLRPLVLIGREAPELVRNATNGCASSAPYFRTGGGLVTPPWAAIQLCLVGRGPFGLLRRCRPDSRDTLHPENVVTKIVIVRAKTQDPQLCQAA